MLPLEIATYLQDQGFGVMGTNIFNESVSKPDDILVVGEYPGEAGLNVKGKRAPVLERPRFQVMCRAKSLQVARQRIETAYQYLDGYTGTIEGVGYSLIRALQPPFQLGKDEVGRMRYVCNFRVQKERSPVGD